MWVFIHTYWLSYQQDILFYSRTSTTNKKQCPYSKINNSERKYTKRNFLFYFVGWGSNHTVPFSWKTSVIQLHHMPGTLIWILLITINLYFYFTSFPNFFLILNIHDILKYDEICFLFVNLNLCLFILLLYMCNWTSVYNLSKKESNFKAGVFYLISTTH